jgi:hypothetical protein
MHGHQLSESLKEKKLKSRENISPRFAGYDLAIPAGQYAVFYSEPMPDSKYSVEVYVYAGNALISYFTVVNAYPFIQEVQNDSAVPLVCNIQAAEVLLSNYNSGGPYTPIAVNATPVNPGVLLAFPTGEVDNLGRPVSQSAFMQIQPHL